MGHGAGFEREGGSMGIEPAGIANTNLQKPHAGKSRRQDT